MYQALLPTFRAPGYEATHRPEEALDIQSEFIFVNITVHLPTNKQNRKGVMFVGFSTFYSLFLCYFVGISPVVYGLSKLKCFVLKYF